MEFVIARQPIFDDRKEVYAFRLLFKGGLESSTREFTEDKKQAAILVDTLFSSVVEKLVDNRMVFIPFTSNLLIKEFYRFAPKGRLVVEIDDSLTRDWEVLDRLRGLRSAGYSLAFAGGHQLEPGDPLLGLVNILKIDFSHLSEEQQYDKARQFVPTGIKMMAEGLETEEQFLSAGMIGYHYFQGSFFCRPTTVKNRRIHEYKVNKVKLLNKVNQHIIDFAEVGNIIKSDLDLSYKLLKYLNSAHFGLRRPITDVKQAVIHLGVQNLRKWASLMAVACLSDGKPTQLLVTAVVRARTCELLAKLFELENRENELFLLGLFSVLDAMLDLPMTEIVRDLPLAPDCKEALIDHEGQMGRVLRYVIGAENGQWNLVESMQDHFDHIEQCLPGIQADAVGLANEVLQL